MPPQVNTFVLPQHQPDEHQQQQQPPSETAQRGDELSSAVEELRRRVSNMQNEMQRQAERHEKERSQWEREKQSMSSQLKQLQTSPGEPRVTPKVEPEIEIHRIEDPSTVTSEYTASIPFGPSPWTPEIIAEFDGNGNGVETKPTILQANIEMGNPLADLESAVEEMLREYNNPTPIEKLKLPATCQSVQQQTSTQTRAYSGRPPSYLLSYNAALQKIRESQKQESNLNAFVSVQNHIVPGDSQSGTDHGAIKKRQSTHDKLEKTRRHGICHGSLRKQPFQQTTHPSENPTAKVEPIDQTSKIEQREAILMKFEKSKDEIVRTIEDMQEKLRQCKTKTGKRQITLDHLKATKATRVAFAELSIDVLADSMSSLESWEPSDSEVPRDQQFLEVGRVRREYERIATYLESHSAEEAKLFHATAMSMRSGRAGTSEVNAALPQRQEEKVQQKQPKEVQPQKQAGGEIEERVDELSSAVKELRLQTARLESDRSRWEEEIQSLKSLLSQQRQNPSDANREQVATGATPKSSGNADSDGKGDNSMLISRINQVRKIPPVSVGSTSKLLKSYERDAAKKKRQKHRSSCNFRAKIEELNRREAEEEKQQRLAYEKAAELGGETVNRSTNAHNNLTMLAGVEPHSAGRNMVDCLYENFFHAKSKSFDKDTDRLIKERMQDEELETRQEISPS